MIVAVPRIAVEVAENETITVQVGLHESWSNVGVTPAGRPDAEKVTGAAVPLTWVATIEDVELVEPWTTVKLLGEGVDNEKSNRATTASDNVRAWVAPPPVAVTVTMVVPGIAVEVAENETVTVQLGLQGLLVKAAVTPVGSADVENVTGAVAPATRVAMIEDEGLVEP